ncbi:permease-like cell division protein FtsX [Thalassotalea agariperforans]
MTKTMKKNDGYQSSRPQVNFFTKLVSLPIRHLQQAVGSLGELWRTPFTTAMTVLVLGISLSLPATLQLFVKNANQITAQWNSASEISLFLKLSISEKSAQNFVSRIELYPEVASVTYISAEQALTDFKALSGFGDALGYLAKNPLPATVLVTPTQRSSQAQAAQELLNKLTQEREVEQGKLDLEWLTRLEAIATLIEDIVFAIGFLLCSSVVLIIGNTIRLAILNQKDAIAVMKLVGATDSFIQRPFLYAGAWYGILGGVFACFAIAILAQYLSGAISALTEVYQQKIELTMLSFSELLLIIGFAVVLGLLGSFMSVRRHIRDIEPTAD